MAKNRKLLILGGPDRSEDARLGYRLDRQRVMNEAKSSGAKVVHDTGGRFVVLEISPEIEEALAKRIPGARLIPLEEVDEDLKLTIEDLDPTEKIFLDAVQLRESESYREAQRKRPGPGETPEEKELLSADGGCVRD